MAFLIVAVVFIFFTLAYAFLAGAVLYHLWHYTLPGWTAARIVVPLFFIFSAILFGLALYFFVTLPWSRLG